MTKRERESVSKAQHCDNNFLFPRHQRGGRRETFAELSQSDVYACIRSSEELLERGRDAQNKSKMTKRIIGLDARSSEL
jgi:hypothetical protein